MDEHNTVVHGFYGVETRPRRLRLNVKRRGVTIYRGAPESDDDSQPERDRQARRAQRGQKHEQAKREQVVLPRKRPNDDRLVYRSAP